MEEGLKIYLDLDGVLINFVYEALTAFDLDGEEIEELILANKGNYKLHEWLNVSENVFWSVLNANFRPVLTNYFVKTKSRNFVNHLRGYGEVIFCTAPSFQLLSYLTSKLRTLAWAFPHLSCIITDRKELLAKDLTTILIDDSDYNIEAFNQAGGLGLLFPRPWNKLNKLFCSVGEEEYSYRYTTKFLEEHIKQLESDGRG